MRLLKAINEVPVDKVEFWMRICLLWQLMAASLAWDAVGWWFALVPAAAFLVTLRAIVLRRRAYRTEGS